VAAGGGVCPQQHADDRVPHRRTHADTLTSSHWALTQRLAGPVAAGKWTGIQNFFGNLSGVAAPAITGFIVQRTGQFYPAFILVVAVILLGACCYGLLIRRVDPIEWSTSR
jgi:nitrate/nitrite transporter NarK